MIDSDYALKAIAAMGLVTFVLRALPFVAAQWIEHHPIVRRLGQFLPLAIMTVFLARVTGRALLTVIVHALLAVSVGFLTIGTVIFPKMIPITEKIIDDNLRRRGCS